MRIAAAALLVAIAAPSAAQTAERIAEIRVHGNHTTPGADVLALSGLVVGEPATETRLKEVEDALRSTRRFAGVEVRRRFQSIEDPSAILVVIVVTSTMPSPPTTRCPACCGVSAWRACGCQFSISKTGTG